MGETKKQRIERLAAAVYERCRLNAPRDNYGLLMNVERIPLWESKGNTNRKNWLDMARFFIEEIERG